MEDTKALNIQDADDFGLFFNCLTRRYLWEFEESLLELMTRIVYRYLPYFNQRTLICSIRDLADVDKSVWRDDEGEVPPDQFERYQKILMGLVKRYLSIEFISRPGDYWKKQAVRQLASEGEFTECYRNERSWKFPSKDAFEEWVYENHLDKGDGIPEWIEETLPVETDFLPDFYQLCLATVQYSYGRYSYMPGACRDFIKKNIALLSRKDIKNIADEIERLLTESPMPHDHSGEYETGFWTGFKKELQREGIRRRVRGQPDVGEEA